MIEHVELPSLLESINMRAYQRYLDRGCEHGHDLEDWLTAEAEVAQELGLSEGRSESEVEEGAALAESVA